MNMRSVLIGIALAALGHMGNAHAEPVEGVMRDWLKEFELCAVRDFDYAELDPDHVLEIKDQGKFRIRAQDRVRVEDLDLEDDGTTIELVLESNHTHGESVDVLVRLFTPILDPKWRSPITGWDKMLLGVLKPILVPCKKAEESSLPVTPGDE